MSNIKNELAEYKKSLEVINVKKRKLIDTINKEINSIKQNGFVKTISTNPCIFTVSSKNISMVSLDPNYYDNYALSQKVISKIESLNDIDKIFSFLHSIVETGQFEDQKKVKIRCNENFLNSLKKILANFE